MKVIFTIDSLQQGGAEQSLAHIIEHFSPSSEITVVYFKKKEDLLPQFEKLNCKLISVDLTGRFTWFKGIKKLKKIIQEIKPNIVVSCLYQSNIISRITCKITGTKLIGTFVSDSYSKERSVSFSQKRKLGAAYFLWIDQLTSKIPIAWIANSESIKKSNCNILGVDPNKVTVIYRGRNADIIQPWKNPQNNQVFRFTFIGRLLETKGLNELVSAFETISESNSNVHLDIFGDGPYKKKITKQVDSSNCKNKITLHGNINNAWQKLYESNCFVFPSWYEGFSGALVEAMMLGIPIVASDISMNLEAVQPNYTALVYPVRNENMLLENMNYCFQHYSKMIEMGNNARNVAIEKFEIKTIAHQYETFLKQKINS
jgi:glycosyltransferase involved in cell wall biosynthesis